VPLQLSLSVGKTARTSPGFGVLLLLAIAGIASLPLIRKTNESGKK
jgi:hypothetical protein